MKKILLLLLFVGVLFAGCKKDKGISTEEMSANFSLQSKPGIYPKGVPVLQFDDNIHQISVNAAKRTFRIQTDNQGVLFNCTLSAVPTAAGQQISVIVDVRGVSGVGSKSYNTVVESLNGDICKLWSGADNIGFIVEFK